MAINKKLIHFDMTKQLFMSNANGLNNLTKPTNGIVGNIPYYSVVFLKDGYIWTHGHFINGTGIADSVSSNATISWSKITDKPSTFTPSAHTQSYTTLTGSGTTANQAIVSSGTANGWVLKTLGSRAFDSTSYLPLAGGTLTGNLAFSGDNSITWSRNTDYAKIHFKNTGDGDSDSYLGFETADNGNEYFRFGHTSGTYTEWMSIKSDGVRVKGTKVSLEGHTHSYLPLSGGTMTGVETISSTSAINLPNRTTYGTRASYYTNGNYIHGGEDHADQDGANIQIGTWYGFGIYPTISGQTRTQGKNSFWHNARTGDTYTWGEFYSYDGSTNRKVLHEGNYTNYTVTKTGSGASGTWGINISGNAATSTNADKLDGYHYNNLPYHPINGSWKPSSLASYTRHWGWAYNTAEAGLASNGTEMQIYTDGKFWQREGAYYCLDNGNTYVSSGIGVINGTTITQVANADTVDGYHANNIYKATSHTINNPYTSNTWIRIATITIPSGVLASAGFTAIFSNRECLEANSFILTLAIRREVDNNSGIRFYYNAIQDLVPETITVRSDDGITFYVYIKSAANSWTTYYNVTKLLTEGNITYENQGTTSPISGTKTNINASKGGNVLFADSATKATQDSDGNQINTTYLKRSGGTMTGTPYISMPGSAAAISDSQPFGITYGRIQGYSNIVIAADTDQSASEYAVITSGYSIANATKANGLAIGHNTLTWKNNTVWHAGNDGSGSGLDADLLDGYHANAFSLSNHNHDAIYFKHHGSNNTDPVTGMYNGYGVCMTTTSGINGNWWHVFSAGWGDNNDWISQLALPTQDTTRGAWFRIRQSSTNSAWIRLLDTQNTYVSGGKGYINNTEITDVNNAEKLKITGYGNSGLTFYQTDKEFDGRSGWCHYIIGNHGNGASYYHYTIGLPFWSVPIYRRQTDNTSHVTPWYKFITEENIGSQSVNYANYSGYAPQVSQTSISSLSSFTHSTNLIYSAVGGDNSVSDKPSGVDAFGVLSYKTANGWYGQLLTSSNTASGLYWRTAISLSGGWRKVLDNANSSVSKSGETLTVKINDTSQSLTNTWRGIQNNLTSSSTTDSLSAYQGHLLANGSARDNTKLPLTGGTMVGTISASSDAYGGGGFHNGYANIILRGNTTTGTSGIVFSSSKGDTSINRPSDCAFIQYHPYGVSAATAVGTNPTIGTSGESGRFVIGIHNDSGDQLWLQTPTINDLKHVVGAKVYTIYDSGNLPAYPTKASWNYDDRYVASVSISGNNLRINKNGTNADLTIPYANYARELYSNANLNSGNTATYPWRRIATTGLRTNNWNDVEATILIRHWHDGGTSAILKISLRTNDLSSGGASSAHARWLVRTQDYSASNVKIALYSIQGKAYADVYLKAIQWQRMSINVLANNGWTFKSSSEGDNSANPIEAYTSIEAAATALYGVAYTSITDSYDVGIVSRAISDSDGNAISTTYLKRSGGSMTNTNVVTNLNADLLDGYHLTSNGKKPWSTIPFIGSDGGMEVGNFFDFHHDNTTGSDYSTRLWCTGNYSNKVYLPSASGTLALTSDNVASATKLQTARTLWGQSFNGTGNVSGNMSGVGTISASGDIGVTKSSGATIVFASNNNGKIGLATDTNRGVYDYTKSRWLIATNGANSWLDAANVGISTTSPSYKLDVNGTLHANGATTLSSTLYVGNNATIAGTLGVYGTTTLKSATTIEANTYISGETFFSAVDAFRLNYGSYGVIHRNDGGSYWILLTDKNDQNGGFNSLRPFHIDFSNGTVHMDNNAIIDNLAFTQCNISMGGRVNATWGYDINSSDYYGLYFKSKNSSSTGILFNDDGNVGIGTTSPLRKLHVIGEAIFGEAGYVASQGTGSNYSGTWVGTGFMELSSPNPFIDFHGNMSTADYTSRLIQWGDKVRLKYENSNGVYSGYVLTCEGNHHNPVILGIFDLKRSGPGSKVWTLDNICGPCIFTLANNWGSDVNGNSNTYWTIPSNLLRVEINGVLGDNYTTKTTVKAAACIGTVMTRWMYNQPIVSNRSHEDIAGCSVECLCTDKAPGTNLYYDSNSPGKYIYITGAKPYGYDEGTNGLSMDQFRSTGHLSYQRVRFVVYGWLE